MKLLIIGDLHYGAKGNSERYNNQINEFLDWSINKFQDVDKVVQLGDWFDDRSKIKVDTLNFSITGAKKLEDGFGKDNVFVITGNHDIPYLKRLDVTSLASIAPYVTLVDSITPLEDVLLTPWIVDGAMWDDLVNQSSFYDYCLGHFELNGFKVNDAYTMEHGFSPKGLKLFDLVVSGHYHSPQRKGNVQYAGTPMPITNNEANEDHGVYVLDTETGDLEFFVYDKVKVVSIDYREIDKIKDLDPENTSIRIEFPDDLEDETLVSETLELLKEQNFSESKIKYRGSKAKQLLDQDVGDVEEVENIDEVVMKYLSEAIDVKGIDNEMLISFYNESVKGEEYSD